MGVVVKACSKCGRSNRTCRCPKRRRPYGTRQYLLARAQTLAEEKVCWICEKPGTPDDPLTADHVVEVAEGGADVRENMHAAHYSCNSRRGQQYQEGGHT